MDPVAPLRCLETMSSARPFFSGVLAVVVIVAIDEQNYVRILLRYCRFLSDPTAWAACPCGSPPHARAATGPSPDAEVARQHLEAREICEISCTRDSGRSLEPISCR
jgi:hypothetical protein